MITEALALQKMALHPSVVEFESHLHSFKTKGFTVRIDKLKDGSLRYVAWSANAKLISKPDLIISNGELDHQGSGGDHTYTFKNGDYRYLLEVTIIGKTDDDYLKVYQGDTLILSQLVIENLNN